MTEMLKGRSEHFQSISRVVSEQFWSSLRAELGVVPGSVAEVSNSTAEIRMILIGFYYPE